LSQERIGWRHFFAGKISQEWLKLQADSTNKTVEKKRDCYVWGASIVEITLGEVRVDPHVEFTLDNWDGQTVLSAHRLM
jgi:hypothetical protein